MDFIALDIPAILVPSPGQSEQEYLGSWLSEKGWFKCVRQDELDLVALQAEGYPEAYAVKKGHLPAKPDFNLLKSYIANTTRIVNNPSRNPEYTCNGICSFRRNRAKAVIPVNNMAITRNIIMSLPKR